MGIFFSPDSGLTWYKEANAIANTGSYEWTVRNLEAEFGQILIQEKENPVLVGYSGFFKVTHDPTGAGAEVAKVMYGIRSAVIRDGVLHVRFSGLVGEYVITGLYAMDGRCVSQAVSTALGGSVLKVPLTAERGVYVLRVMAGDRVWRLVLPVVE